MPLGRRTRLSLAQLLALQPRPVLEVLLEKYGFSLPLDIEPIGHLARVCTDAADVPVLQLLDETTRTSGDLRTRVSPKYAHDQRMKDLERCLSLDGYRVASEAWRSGAIVPITPELAGTRAPEDDLAEALEASSLPDAPNVSELLRQSADAFMRVPADYNASLTSARAALQVLATAIARMRSGLPLPFDDAKWGAVLQYLRSVDFITIEEEKGLAGVFGFVSPGAHKLVSGDEEEMARLGRSLCVSMSYFLLREHLKPQP